MTKKEINKLIISRFLTFVETEFPQYTIDDSGEGGRITLQPNHLSSDDAIDFHRSRYTLDTYNWASNQTFKDCAVMEMMLQDIVKEVTEEPAN